MQHVPTEFWWCRGGGVLLSGRRYTTENQSPCQMLVACLHRTADTILVTKPHTQLPAALCSSESFLWDHVVRLVEVADCGGIIPSRLRPQEIDPFVVHIRLFHQLGPDLCGKVWGLGSGMQTRCGGDSSSADVAAPKNRNEQYPEEDTCRHVCGCPFPALTRQPRHQTTVDRTGSHWITQDNANVMPSTIAAFSCHTCRSLHDSICVCTQMGRPCAIIKAYQGGGG